MAKATNDEQKSRVGNQVGGRVLMILHTDNFDEDYKLYKRNGVEFMEEPRNEKYGKVVVFKDLYGNMYRRVSYLIPLVLKRYLVASVTL